jgi:hypothetical protein
MGSCPLAWCLSGGARLEIARHVFGHLFCIIRVRNAAVTDSVETKLSKFFDFPDTIGPDNVAQVHDDAVALHWRNKTQLVFAPLGHPACAVERLARVGFGWEIERMCVSGARIGD